MTHVDVSSFALKTNLANSKTEVDKIDIAKLTVPNDLAKLGNVDTTGFVLKITHGADKSDLEKKISDAEKKIPNTSDLAKSRFINSFWCISTIILSHHQLQYALDFGLLKHMSLWCVSTIIQRHHECT